MKIVDQKARRAQFLRVQNDADVDSYMATVRNSASHLKDWIAHHSSDPLDLLYQLKFEMVGHHPIDERSLNIVEQVNQTWTYAVALAAAKFLLSRHPEAEGFKIAPGAHMALPLDIMSMRPNVVGAETFAAVHPRNNDKLRKDVEKLAARTELHRYVFFGSPRYPGLNRLRDLEKESGIQIWSVDLDLLRSIPSDH